MPQLNPAEIRRPVDYLPVRAQARQRMVELHRDRRLLLGDLVSLVFESRETVKGMVEAIVCAAWVDSPECIADEVALFNVLLPAGDVRASLFVAARDAADVQCGCAAGRTASCRTSISFSGTPSSPRPPDRRAGYREDSGWVCSRSHAEPGHSELRGDPWAVEA